MFEEIKTFGQFCDLIRNLRNIEFYNNTNKEWRPLVGIRECTYKRVEEIWNSDSKLRVINTKS